MRWSMTAGKASGALVACLASFACLSGTALGAELPVSAAELPASIAATEPIPTVNDVSALAAPSGVIAEAGASKLIPAPLVEPIQAIEQTATKLESDAQTAVTAATIPAAAKAATTPAAATLPVPVTTAAQPNLATPPEVVSAADDASRMSANGARRTASTRPAPATSSQGDSSLAAAADATRMSTPVAAAMAAPAPRVAGSWVVSDAPGRPASRGGSMVAAAASSVVGSGLDKLAWSSQDAAGMLGLMLVVGGFVLAYRSRMVVRYVECPG